MFSVKQGVFTLIITEKYESRKYVAKRLVEKYPALTVPQNSAQILCDRFRAGQNHNATML